MISQPSDRLVIPALLYSVINSAAGTNRSGYLFNGYLSGSRKEKSKN